MPNVAQNKDKAPDLPTGFLGQIAQNLIREEGTNLLSQVLIFPNTRSAWVFKEMLIRASRGKALVFPKMYSIDEWVQSMTEQQVISELEARLFLFESFKAVRNPDEKMDTFFSLGQVLFQDFELIVRNLKPVSLVYKELSLWEETGAAFSDFLEEEQKEMLARFWSSFEPSALSEGKKRFISLWKSLPAVFQHFQESLRARGLCTSAMAYAQVAERLGSQEEMGNGVKIHFVGFGQLSLSVVKMMQALILKEKAVCHWDIHPWFLGQIFHEYFRLFSSLRRFEGIGKSLEAAFSSPHSDKPQPEISIEYALGNAGMAHAIKAFAEKRKPNCALFLTDPLLVEAILEAGFSEPFPYNFTLGVPLLFSNAFAWWEKVFYVVSIGNSPPKFHWEKVTQGPFWESLAFVEKPFWMSQSFEQPKAWFLAIHSWWQSLDFTKIENQKEQLACQNITSLLNKLEELISISKYESWTYPSIRQYFISLSSQFPLALANPCGDSLQVMGLYEGRLLEYDEVMIAPAEEGKFPSGNQTNSFITENLRKAFGLPLMREKAYDEVYQFYRLFHHAQKITLLLNKSIETKPSRFVQQIKYSLDFFSNIQNQEAKGSIPLPKPIVLQKNDWFFQKMESFQVKEGRSHPFSPSSFQDLMSCHLRFYFKKLANLESPEETTDLEMDPRDFGNWVHQTIQLLFEQLIIPQTWLTKADYEKMKMYWPMLEEKVWNSLPNKLSNGKLSDFLIEKEVGKVMAFRFLNHMADQKRHQWLGNEISLTPLPFEAAGKSWAISGRTDLVFESEDQIWLVDLKSGGFEDNGKYILSEKKIENLKKHFVSYKELFQMVSYALIGNQRHFVGQKPVKSFLFFMADPQGKLLDPLESFEDPAPVFEKVKALYQNEIELFMDSARPILQTDDLKKCQYCDYAKICQRSKMEV